MMVSKALKHYIENETRFQTSGLDQVYAGPPAPPPPYFRINKEQNTLLQCHISGGVVIHNADTAGGSQGPGDSARVM